MDTEGDRSVSLQLPFPFGEEQVFRYRAMEDVLELLIHNPFREFTVRQLREQTGNGTKTTTQAVKLLTQLELVSVDTDGRSKDVRLNRNRVTIPDDPIFAIPQDEFRPPVRAFVERARDEIPAFSALLVFGSVARGEADRQSDVDIWILVDDADRLLEARRTATSIASDLEEEAFSTSRRTSSGDRYEFEILVESVESASSHADELGEILAEGIVIVDSDDLQRVKEAVLNGTKVETDA